MSRKYRRYARKHMKRRDNNYKRRRIHRVIGQIFFWLFLFVVGSLVVGFILSPSASKLKDDVFSKVDGFIEEVNLEAIEEVNLDSNINIDNFETTPPKKIETKETFEEINVGAICSLADVEARYLGMPSKELKNAECEAQCGLRDKYFNSFKCDKNQLICYCYK